MKLLHFLFLIGIGISTFLQSFGAPPKSLPVYAFQNGVHFKTVKERVQVLKELGYDGIGSAKLSQSDLSLPDRLKAYGQAGLKIFSFYLGGKLSPEGHTFQYEIPEAIRQLKGHDTILELYIQGSKKNNTDEQAIAFVQEIADLAEKSGLRVVLYPHAGFYIDTLSDAIRIARKCRRNNVGVMFNLCHFLKVEPKENLKVTLLEAKDLLWQVSTSGAEIGGTNWGQLIQTLDRGDFDQKTLFQILNEIGFSGNVGFQCYAIRGNSRENLKRSMDAWKKLR
jgi:sugar phosphate isomerase/epimerase